MVTVGDKQHLRESSELIKKMTPGYECRIAPEDLTQFILVAMVLADGVLIHLKNEETP